MVNHRPLSEQDERLRKMVAQIREDLTRSTRKEFRRHYFGAAGIGLLMGILMGGSLVFLIESIMK